MPCICVVEITDSHVLNFHSRATFHFPTFGNAVEAFEHEINPCYRTYVHAVRDAEVLPESYVLQMDDLVNEEAADRI